MNKNLKTIGAICFLLFSFFIYLNAAGVDKATPVKKEKTIKITPELEKKYHLKTEHGKISLDCIYCHEGQGEDPKKFEAPDEEICLKCHKSKEYLAKRLEFMDTLKSNPHNSVHDGPNLYCDECHREHVPSVNMCSECHLKEIKNNIWMKDTP